MADEARYTLIISGLGLADAQALTERIETDIRLDPKAVAINESDEEAQRWETVVYFGSEAEAAVAREIVGGEIARLPDADWVKRSLEGLAPVAAGRFFLHGSHDRARRRDGGISLEIDAGTAFGTGHHGTTEGCLLALDRILKRRRPRRILDVGAGTGVLAIAAVRATGNSALASDIDPEAVKVTRLNADNNGVRGLITAIAAPGLKDQRIAALAPYDLIFANILARPLVSLASGLAQILAANGNLVLSGLTLDQCRWVLATYRNRGLVPVENIFRGNWATLVLTKHQMKKRPDRFRAGRLDARAQGPGWEEA
jgi:ribosomal protein L11 methyltransferase